MGPHHDRAGEPAPSTPRSPCPLMQPQEAGRRLLEREHCGPKRTKRKRLWRQPLQKDSALQSSNASHALGLGRVPARAQRLLECRTERPQSKRQRPSAHSYAGGLVYSLLSFLNSETNIHKTEVEGILTVNQLSQESGFPHTWNFPFGTPHLPLVSAWMYSGEAS